MTELGSVRAAVQNTLINYARQISWGMLSQKKL